MTSWWRFSKIKKNKNLPPTSQEMRILVSLIISTLIQKLYSLCNQTQGTTSGKANIPVTCITGGDAWYHKSWKIHLQLRVVDSRPKVKTKTKRSCFTKRFSHVNINFSPINNTFPLLICTWYLRNQFGKMKWRRTGFLVSFELDFYCLCSL